MLSFLSITQRTVFLLSRLFVALSDDTAESVVSSGAINIVTGLARDGDSGILSIRTGDSAVHDAGSIAVEGVPSH